MYLTGQMVSRAPSGGYHGYDARAWSYWEYTVNGAPVSTKAGIDDMTFISHTPQKMMHMHYLNAPKRAIQYRWKAMAIWVLPAFPFRKGACAACPLGFLRVVVCYFSQAGRAAPVFYLTLQQLVTMQEIA